MSFFVALALSTHVASAQWAHLVMSSEEGDWIGGGADWDLWYTPATSFFWHAQVTNNVLDLPSALQFAMGLPADGNGFDGTIVGLAFNSNSLGSPLDLGLYQDAERAPFQSAGHPGLAIDFQHRGPNAVNGQFEVRSLLYHEDALAMNGFVVDYFLVDFIQYADNSESALRGTFEYSAVPEPITLIAIAPTVILVRRRRKQQKQASKASDAREAVDACDAYDPSR